MASPKQIEANKRNAKKSTGPRTSAGKKKVAVNAVKHGLLAQQVVLPNEDEEEFAEFAIRLAHELQPVGELEDFLVGMIAACAWRLRRLQRVERCRDTVREYEPHPGRRYVKQLVDGRWETSPAAP